MKKILFLIILMLGFILCSCRSNNYNLYFDKTVEIVCETYSGKSSATGFFVTNDGLILTNKHVVKKVTNEDVINVRINSGDIKIGTIYDISNEYDLALIKIDYEGVYFKLNEKFNLGEKVYSIGNQMGYGLSLYEGIISSELKNIIYNDVSTLSLQTNIEIYDGCSGGPLFNTNGEVLGVMTFRIKDKNQNIPGISYAIPSKIINEYLRSVTGE